MVEIKGISKKYKNNVLFRLMDFKVEDGEICGIIGENGSGKSTLLKMICGLATPDEGTIEIDGEEVVKDRFPQDIGVILDCAGFLPYYCGIENLRILARAGIRAGERELEHAMRQAGLDPASKVKVGKYSSGMRWRLALAQAIMENPKLLILDEPMNAIDDNMFSEMRRLLEELNKRGKVTIIMTSNRQDELADFCTSMYKIRDCMLYRED